MLWRVGQRPIKPSRRHHELHNVRDGGSPTHGFDRKHITGGIYVRRAYEGEQLVLLDGETLTLTSEDLVI